MIKIPVHQHSVLWEAFANKTSSSALKSDKSRPFHRSHSEGSLRQVRENLMYSTNVNFMSADSTSEFSDTETTDCDGNEKTHASIEIDEKSCLLNKKRRTVNAKNETNNVCEEYLDLVDKDIQHISKRLQAKTGVVDIVGHSLAYIQPNSSNKSDTDVLGKAGWCNYKGLIFVLCTVSIILPLLYVLYFLFISKDR